MFDIGVNLTSPQFSRDRDEVVARAQAAGVTGMLLLRESHISIHTWPEHGFAAVDVFMCGGARPEKAVDAIASALAARSVEVREIARG